MGSSSDSRNFANAVASPLPERISRARVCTSSLDRGRRDLGGGNDGLLQAGGSAEIVA